MVAPCKDCQSRSQMCHGNCPDYLLYRGERESIRKKRQAEAAADTAGFLRGDKIRRDVHRHGIAGKRK